ncbi:MAG: hypothetical protein WCQ49_00625 [Candidatus Saccharibacteria bacterium]
MNINKSEHEFAIDQIFLSLGVHANELLESIKKEVEINYNKGGNSHISYYQPVSRHCRKSLEEYSTELVQQAVMGKLNSDKSVSVNIVQFSRPGLISNGSLYIHGSLFIK